MLSGWRLFVDQLLINETQLNNWIFLQHSVLNDELDFKRKFTVHVPTMTKVELTLKNLHFRRTFDTNEFYLSYLYFDKQTEFKTGL